MTRRAGGGRVGAPGGQWAARNSPDARKQQRAVGRSMTAPTTGKRERVARGMSPASVRGVEFSRELRDDVLAGDITLSVRLWKRPQVQEGGRYRVGPGLIEVDAIELVPFAAITEADVRQAGEPTARPCATAPRTRGRSRRTPSSTGSTPRGEPPRLSWGARCRTTEYCGSRHTR